MQQSAWFKNKKGNKMIEIHKAVKQDGRVASRLLKEKYNFSSLSEANKIFQNEIRYCHFRIAQQATRVIGIIGWRVQGTLKHGVIELTRIAVSSNYDDPLYVKEMLFDVMIAEADYYYKQRHAKLRKVFSMIHADKKHIKDFFINKGMQQEAILRNHFRHGTDELIFSIFLN